MSAQIVLLDRVLAHYGPETKELRETLRTTAATALERLDSASPSESSRLEHQVEEEFGTRFVASISLPEMRKCREFWGMAPVSARKKLERLRTFFKFFMESGWARGNPAKFIRAPLARTMPTLPFTDGEIEKILWGTEVYPKKGIYGVDSGRRVRAFINQLR